MNNLPHKRFQSSSSFWDVKWAPLKTPALNRRNQQTAWLCDHRQPRPQGLLAFAIWRRQERRPWHTVALQLCPPLQFGPLTYQPIEWGFVSSNQSALWWCLLHVTSQLGEGSSMSFVRFSVLIVWKTCVWNTFGAFSLMGLENFTEVWGLFETFLGQRIFSYVGELESLGQGWKHNQRVRRRTVATRMYFRASEVRCYLQYFQRRFYTRIRVMVQISSS